MRWNSGCALTPWTARSTADRTSPYEGRNDSRVRENSSSDSIKSVIWLTAIRISAYRSSRWLGCQVALAKKLRVRHDCRQRMPQIVRDRTRHPPDRRQPLRIQQFSLCFLQIPSHPVEGAGDLGDFVPALGVQRIRIVPLLQRAHSRHQILQRTREGVRDQEDQQAPGQHRRQPKRQQQLVQAAQECGGLIERLQHPQIQSGRARRWQIHRRRQKIVPRPDGSGSALRRASSRRPRRDAQQLRFLGRLQSAADNRISIAKRHFARRHPAQVAGNPVVDFVTQHQVSQNPVLARRTKINSPGGKLRRGGLPRTTSAASLRATRLGGKTPAPGGP